MAKGTPEKRVANIDDPAMLRVMSDLVAFREACVPGTHYWLRNTMTGPRGLTDEEFAVVSRHRIGASEADHVVPDGVSINCTCMQRDTTARGTVHIGGVSGVAHHLARCRCGKGSTIRAHNDVRDITSAVSKSYVTQGLQSMDAFLERRQQQECVFLRRLAKARRACTARCRAETMAKGTPEKRTANIDDPAMLRVMSDLVAFREACVPGTHYWLRNTMMGPRGLTDEEFAVVGRYRIGAAEADHVVPDGVSINCACVQRDTTARGTVHIGGVSGVAHHLARCRCGKGSTIRAHNDVRDITSAPRGMATAATTEDKLLLALADASDSGNTAEVSRLLDAGAPVNGMWPTEDGKTPLLRASEHGHVDTMRLLLDRGASVDAADRDGKTPLLHAYHCSDVDTMRLLLDHGASVDDADDDKKTALLHASEYGEVDIVRLLLDHGASVDAADYDGKTALLHAAERGHVDIVRLLLDHGASVDDADDDGKTALLHAAEYGDVDIVRLLLDHGASVDAADRNGVTALLRASEHGRVDIVRLLLDRGASVDATDRAGVNALATCSCLECQTLLRGFERPQRWHRRHSLVTWGHAANRLRD
ncbi:hypothetical protein FNF27_07908 [Cafeteria roenbergensis]|uniref:Uncharacterized protein n=1 Tax=Cafeteria roenbergensis TaxID=33653 RepID=A0A5A8DGE9_CAFRO|nr:hypothetical protein FNF27_07908 [Cafeteria roenbergensis]